MKKRGNWALRLSITSAILSIVVFLMWFCKYEPVTWTLLDSCFAVLSTGMTLFVASQVYHSFTLTRQIDEKNRLLKEEFEKENKRLMDEYRTEFEDKMRCYDHNVTALAKQLFAINIFFKGNYEDALDVFMEALHEANLSKKNEISGIENPTQGILSFIKALQEKEKLCPHLPKEKVDRYKKILVGTGTNEAIDLIPYIQSLAIGEKEQSDIEERDEQDNGKSSNVAC